MAKIVIEAYPIILKSAFSISFVGRHRESVPVFVGGWGGGSCALCVLCFVLILWLDSFFSRSRCTYVCMFVHVYALFSSLYFILFVFVLDVFPFFFKVRVFPL